MKKFLVLVFLGISFISFSQHLPQVKLAIDGSGFAQVSQEIEAQTNLKLYYDEGILDTLLVEKSSWEGTVDELLKSIFEGSSLSYHVFDNNLFIVNDRVIQVALPENYLEASESRGERISLVDFNTQIVFEENEPESKTYSVGVRTNRITAGNATIKGKIVDSKTGEAMIGASVFISEPLIGVATDPLGYYSLEIPKGRHQLTINSLGMKPVTHELILYSDGTLNLELVENTTSLNEVVVEAERDDNLSEAQLGVEKISIKQVKLVPTALGETDIVRVMLTLPGVKTVGEAANGFNVRGGSTDQNLILYNESTIYNPAHLFGFFSAFNPDVIQSAELFKSSIPSRYGGRLSSVLLVSSREGNKKKFSGSGGIGPVTGRLALEGPIGERTSFLFGARANYSNWILNTVKNSSFQNSSGSFYDLNLHIDHELNANNSFHFYAYQSDDRFKLRNDTTYQYQNQAINLRWRHLFNKSFYGDFSIGGSAYDYSVFSENRPIDAFDLRFGIGQSDFRADFNYFGKKRHSINFGATASYYKIQSGSIVPLGNESIVEEDILDDEQALEYSIYVGDNIELTPNLSLNAGLRFTSFSTVGPRDYFVYAEGQPRTDATIVDTVSTTSGSFIQTYNRPEVRFSLRYSLSKKASVKFGYNTLNQFLHRISNTVAISPTDIWKFSDINIKPQSGNQISLGYFRNIFSGFVEASFEGYYKRFSNFLDYKSGAVVLLNPNLEADVINTRGRAYGIELLLRKNQGRLNGWVGYTYSRSEIRQDDALAGELINRGEWYPANFDKPHDFTLVSNYKLSHRVSTSFNATYSTGRPITVPIEKFEFEGGTRVFYSDRNAFRVPDYFRIDLALTIDGSHKLKKLAHGSWTIAVYNLTGRRNANSIYFLTENGNLNGYQLSIFGQAIPTVTYNFKF